MAKRRRRVAADGPCPCGSELVLSACCGPIVGGVEHARTAEALMRSRYTAFAIGDLDHLVRSWHPDHRPADLTLDAAQTWLGLDVLDTVGGSSLDATGEVEFAARYRNPDGDGTLHERSRFTRDKGRWVYVAPMSMRAQDS